MALNDDFKRFCQQIRLSEKYIDMQKVAGDIAEVLNAKYYGLKKNRESHMHIVGSVGRKTAVNSCSDLDLLFELPENVFERFNCYKSNGQSELLQEIKRVLKGKYAKADVVGSGQVVDIADKSFSHYIVELVPAFKQKDGRFKYPDTHNGGSWKFTNPKAEQNACKECQNELFYDFCHILREWKNKVNLVFGGLLIDTLVHDFFIKHDWYSQEPRKEYFEILIDLFDYLRGQSKNQYGWKALGSGDKIENKDHAEFAVKAGETYDILYNTKQSPNGSSVLNAVISSILGELFLGASVAYIKGSKTNFTARLIDIEAQKIAKGTPVDIKYHLSVVVNVSTRRIVEKAPQFVFRKQIRKPQSAFVRAEMAHELTLRRYAQNTQNKEKRIFLSINNTDCIAPYDVYWMENRKNELDNVLIKRDDTINIPLTRINDLQYVDCCVVKNDICVARQRIDRHILKNVAKIERR